MEMQVGRNLALLQGKHHFHQPSNAGGCLQVADVGFHRADIERLLARAKDRLDRPDLDWITQRSAGAMSFQIGDLFGGQTGIGQRLLDHSFLGGAIGDGQPAAGAILVHRRAANHGQHIVTRGHGIGEPFQDDDATPFAARKTIGMGIKGFTVTIGR